MTLPQRKNVSSGESRTATCPDGDDGHAGDRDGGLRDADRRRCVRQQADRERIERVGAEVRSDEEVRAQREEEAADEIREGLVDGGADGGGGHRGLRLSGAVRLTRRFVASCGGRRPAPR